MTKYAISLESVEQAAGRLEGIAHRTPVLTCQALNTIATEATGQELRLFFKCENLQKVGAFKYRGAFNAIKHHLEQQEPGAKPAFVAYSSGNHGQGIALAARDAGCKAIVVMPETASMAKQQAIRGYGAQVVLCAPVAEVVKATAQQYVEQHKAHYIPPANDPDVMSGQGTAVLELLNQAQADYSVELDAVIVPIGGGGLCSGAAMAAKSRNASIKVFGAEPAGASDAYESFAAKQLLGHATPPNTIADGLRATMGDLTWPLIRDLVDDVALATDTQIAAAMKLIWERMKLIVEPSSAVALAALLAGKLPLAGVKNVGIVITGGNVDLDHLPWLAAL